MNSGGFVEMQKKKKKVSHNCTKTNFFVGASPALHDPVGQMSSAGHCHYECYFFVVAAVLVSYRPSHLLGSTCRVLDTRLSYASCSKHTQDMNAPEGGTYSSNHLLSDLLLPNFKLARKTKTCVTTVCTDRWL